MDDKPKENPRFTAKDLRNPASRDFVPARHSGLRQVSSARELY
jgi:hypothetical protein